MEFRDTDAAGIAHFSVFFVYMEQAEHELLRQLGLSVATATDRGEIGWPRVSAACEYHQPARFEDVLQVTVTVNRLGRKSVTYGFHFARDGRGDRLGQRDRRVLPDPPRSSAAGIDIPPEFADKLRAE